MISDLPSTKSTVTIAMTKLSSSSPKFSPVPRFAHRYRKPTLKYFNNQINPCSYYQVFIQVRISYPGGMDGDVGGTKNGTGWSKGVWSKFVFRKPGFWGAVFRTPCATFFVPLCAFFVPPGMERASRSLRGRPPCHRPCHRMPSHMCSGPRCFYNIRNPGFAYQIKTRVL